MVTQATTEVPPLAGSVVRCRSSAPRTLGLLTLAFCLADGAGCARPEATLNYDARYAACAAHAPAGDQPAHGPVGVRSLIEAVDWDCASLAEYLLDSGVDPNGTWKAWTPLAAAAATERLEMARLLLARGADPSVAGTGGYAPLSLACAEQTNLDMVRLLARELFDRNALDENQLTRALQVAATNGNLAAVELLCDSFGAAPLLEKHRDELVVPAAAGGSAPLVARLLALGANPNYAPRALKTSTRSGRLFESPLDAAVTSKNLGVAKLLLDAGADPNARDAMGQPLLVAAVTCNGVALVELLLAAGANPDAATAPGNTTALHEAYRLAYCVIAEKLLDAGASVARKNRFGSKPFEAASRACPSHASRLLEDPSTPEAQGTYKRSPWWRPAPTEDLGG